LPPNVTVSTAPNALRRSKLRHQRTPAAKKMDDSSTSNDERHTTREKKFHLRHDKGDKHKPIHWSRSIGEDANPRPEETEKTVKSLEDVTANINPLNRPKPPARLRLSLQKRNDAESKPKKYDGLACVETFLVKFNACARYNNWQPADKAAHLINCLTDRAALLLWDSEDDTFDQLSKKLRRKYGSR